MIKDAWVVCMQELRHIVHGLLPASGAFLGFALSLLLFGLVVPVALDRGWLNATGYLFLWFWLAYIIVAGPISDSFAGEREQHTLSTLFATRLPTRSILIGKIAAVALYGMIFTLLAIIVSALLLLLMDNTSSGTDAMPGFIMAAAILTPLVALMAATAGAVFSLTARTARQAQQATTVFAPVLTANLVLIAWIVRSIAPQTIDKLSPCLLPLLCNGSTLMIDGIFLLVFTAVGFQLALIRLKRSRVIPA